MCIRDRTLKHPCWDLMASCAAGLAKAGVARLEPTINHLNMGRKRFMGHKTNVEWTYRPNLVCDQSIKPCAPDQKCILFPTAERNPVLPFSSTCDGNLGRRIGIRSHTYSKPNRTSNPPEKVNRTSLAPWPDCNIEMNISCSSSLESPVEQRFPV